MIAPLALLILLITVLTAASPVPVGPNVRIKANNFINIQCRGPGSMTRLYTPAQQQSAANEIRRLANVPIPNRPRSVGGKEQPHTYNVNAGDKSPAVDQILDLMPECQTRQRGKTWFLYPILSGGTAFQNRMQPGPDRVLVVADGTRVGQYRNFVYCGAVFHDNDEYDGFEPCYET